MWGGTLHTRDDSSSARFAPALPLRGEQLEEQLRGGQPSDRMLTRFERHLGRCLSSNDCPSLVESDRSIAETMVASNGSFRRNSARTLCATQVCERQRACGAHVHGIVDAQFFGEHARTKRPVSSTLIPRRKRSKPYRHFCSTEVSTRSGSGRA